MEIQQSISSQLGQTTVDLVTDLVIALPSVAKEHTYIYTLKGLIPLSVIQEHTTYIKSQSCD